MMRRLAPDARLVPILANPRAGKGRSRRRVVELENALRHRDLSPCVCWRREELDAVLASCDGAAIRCIVAAGGDGTLLDVVNRAAGIPATVLPLGNENLVARHCHIRSDGKELAEIIATGQLRQFDLARANGRLFCLMASVGLDAEVVHRVHRRRRGHINRFSYALPLVQAIQSYHFPVVEVEIVDTGERLRGAMAFVFNLPEYALGLPIAFGGSAEDGLLDVCVFEKPGVLESLRYLAAVATWSHRTLADFQHRRARRVNLSANAPAPVQTDGDPAGGLPCAIEVLPAALLLVAPEPT